MGYFIVPINNGVLDIDYDYLYTAVVLSPTQGHVILRPGYTIRETWTAISEEEFNQVKESLPSGEESADLETRVTNLETVVDTILTGGA